jgi:hypothetical protein
MTFGSSKPVSFQDHVEGTWGRFHTPAGEVDYILTKARLGPAGIDPERRLTSHLVPVREVLQSEDLDFNQLLQRDLDDHRVSVSLIPYLLTSRHSGPALFPPIMAVLLPFQDKRPGSFPELSTAITVEDGDISFQQQDAEDQVRIRKMVDSENDRFHSVSFGQVWWNPEHAELVVLDGQHRAMALLAIDRTLRGQWIGSTGEKYRFFYEGRIQDLLDQEEVDLASVEVPVMICWFPTLFGPDESPHLAARKLFVDVNKEARQPSESRIILLSDVDLLNILSRQLLSALRNDASGQFLPLYAVEYDNPDPNATTSGRWSVLTNIHTLKLLTSRMVFGPAKYVDDVQQSILGRENQTERDFFMRQQLEVGSLFADTIPAEIGEAFSRDELGEHNFPPSAVPHLVGAFDTGWGCAILRLLSDVAPYKAHWASLSELKRTWITSDSVDSLAYDALFGGVGMYWTLRDSYDHYREQERLAAARGEAFSRPEVARAWEVLLTQRDAFRRTRSQALLGSASSEKITKSNEAFEVFNTNACQLGLGLAFAVMWRRARTETSSVALAEAAEQTASAINAWFAAKSQNTLFLNRSETDSLNVLSGSMDTSRGIEFRYLWLEVLSSPAALAELSFVDESRLLTYRDLARRRYLAFWTKLRRQSLRSANPGLPDDELSERAADEASQAMKRSLKRWFNVTSKDFEAWLSDSDTTLDAEGSDTDQSLDGDEAALATD